MADFSPIPPYTFPVVPVNLDVGVVARDVIARTARKIADTQLAVCGANEPLRYGYGRNRVGALILRPVVAQNSTYLYVPFIIGRGPIDAVEAVEIDDHALDNDVLVQTYTGAAGQGIDAALAAAWLTHGTTYADTLPGIAWGWVRLTAHNRAPSLAITITARMLKLYDPRQDSTNGGSGSQRLADKTTWAYSACPALWLADMLSNTVYGKGESVDWASVIALANLNDASVGGKPRRWGGLMVERQTDLDAWEQTLRTYAGCWVVREGVTVRLIPDVASTAVYAFTNAAGSANYLVDSIKIAQRRRGATPTVVSVVWTDTTQKPWAEQTYTEPSAQAQAGSLPWREEVIQLPGIQDLSMAKREAIRRLNEYMAADISGSLVAMDSGIQLRLGDVVTVTDSGGMAAKPFRLTGHKPQALGRWAESLVEYDPAIYSDAVVTQGSVPDSNLPDPAAPPTVATVDAVEEIYQVQTGLFASRIRVTWIEPLYPFTLEYRIDVLQAGVLVDWGSAGVGSTEFVSKALKESLLYTVNVTVRSTAGALGTPGSDTVTTSGKSAIPTDVAVLNGYDVGGEVRLSWSPAVDLDLTGYEIRFGLTSDTWDSATLLDRVATPTLRYTTKLVPPGTKRFFIKALDSVRSSTYPFGQPSANAAFCDVAISLDPDSFLAATHTWTTPGLTNMVATGSTPPSWLTDYGTTFSALFTSALATYTNPLASYFGSGVSTLLTETFDMGQVYAGLLTNNAQVTNIAGSASIILEASLDGVTFTQFPGQSAQIAGRYVRLRITTTGVMLVTDMGLMQLSVVAVSETGSVMTSVAGWTTVTLTRKYSKVKTIQLTSDGSLGVANPVYDQNSITLVGDPRFVALTYVPEDYVDEAYSPLGSFAVECFDNNDVLLARSTNYLFQGI